MFCCSQVSNLPANLLWYLLCLSLLFFSTPFSIFFSWTGKVLEEDGSYYEGELWHGYRHGQGTLRNVSSMLLTLFIGLFK